MLVQWAVILFDSLWKCGCGILWNLNTILQCILYTKNTHTNIWSDIDVIRLLAEKELVDLIILHCSNLYNLVASLIFFSVKKKYYFALIGPVCVNFNFWIVCFLQDMYHVFERKWRGSPYYMRYYLLVMAKLNFQTKIF